MKKLHNNVAIFCMNTFKMPISMLIFHDFGMIISVLV